MAKQGSLTFSDRPLPETPADEMIKWVIQEQHTILKQHSVELKKNLCLTETYILDHMEQYGALSNDESERIRSLKQRKEQVTKFLDVLKRKGHTAFDYFVDSLKEDCHFYLEKFEPYKSEKLIAGFGVKFSNGISAEKVIDDPYYLPDTADEQYITTSITRCANKPLNSFEENPSYTLKRKVEAPVIDTDSIADLLKVFAEYAEKHNPYDMLPEERNQIVCPAAETLVSDVGDNRLVSQENQDCTENTESLTKLSNGIDDGQLIDEDYCEIDGQESTKDVNEITLQTNKADENCKSVEATGLQSGRSSTVDMDKILSRFLTAEKCTLVTGSNVILCQKLTSALCDASFETTNCFAYTASNTLVLLEKSAIKLVGDPQGEDWYFPVKVTSAQMERLLSETTEKGSFYVYKTNKSSVDVPYNLSVNTNECGDVMHYHLHKNEDNELLIKQAKESLKFQNIHILVDYFRLNRGILACRLRWSPQELEHYEPNYPPSRKLDNKKLQIDYHDKLENSMIGCQSSFIYKGCYNNKSVVVKTPSNFPLSKSEEDDFLVEARALDQIKHQNIRKLIGVCYIDSNPHLILDYAGKCNLLEYVKKNENDLDGKDIVDIFVQVVHALKYLYEKKYIIHRDIAARNCLVQEDTPSGIRVQLADFGMAVKVVEYDEYHADDDEIYPYRWAAPEVLKFGRFSTKSDIWAAGLLFWELISGGKMPYYNLRTNEEVAAAVTRGDSTLTFPSNANSCKSLRHMFKEYIKPCWSYNPEERPSARRLFIQSRHCLGTIREEGQFDQLYDVHHGSLSLCGKSSTRKSVGKKIKSIFKKK